MFSFFAFLPFLDLSHIVGINGNKAIFQYGNIMDKFNFQPPRLNFMGKKYIIYTNINSALKWLDQIVTIVPYNL